MLPTPSRQSNPNNDALACRQAWRSDLISFEALEVTPSGTAASADLGGSSEYSNEIFED